MVVYFWEISMVGKILWATYCHRKIFLTEVAGKAQLNYNKMVALVTKIKGCLNWRQPTYLNEEKVCDLLTPNHLIYGGDINADQITSWNVEINGKEMRRNASTSRNIINHLMKRFMTDYMLALQERHSNQQQKSYNTCALWVKGDSAPRLS